MLEQRKHKRFQAPDGTRALACGKIGKVVDISSGGLSLIVLDGAITAMTGEFCLDLLCNERRIDARQIPGKIIWNKDISFSAISGMIYKKVGVQFGKLSQTQRRQLRSFS